MGRTALGIWPVHGYLGLHSRRCAYPFPWPMLTHRESCDTERSWEKGETFISYMDSDIVETLKFLDHFLAEDLFR